MALNVYLPRPAGGAFEQELRRRVPADVSLHVGTSRPEPATYEVLVAGRPTEEDLAASPALSTVIIPFAGLPPTTRTVLLERRRSRPELAVHNLHHNAPATAEMAVGLLLAAGRGILPADRALREGDWRPRYDTDQGLRLVGSRALVLGLGAIGARVARALIAFDMQVHAIRFSPRRGDAGTGATVHGTQDLDALLAETDVVVLCVPSTEGTRALLDARRLALLPSHAVLVNVSRGDVVEEGALYRALSDGALGAAGLDVWYRYPADEPSRAATWPSRLPFHLLANVVLSPHRAGHGRGTERERAAHLATALGAAARGDPIPGPVDLDRGY